MANYYAHVRSNYFKVKDRKAFEDYCGKHQLKLIGDGDVVGFLGDDADGGGLCNGYFDEKDTWVEEDTIEGLAKFLCDEEVAIVMEIGYEKMRYLIGMATAINSKGEMQWVNLDQIYDVAEELGTNITKCEY